jgi:hypothetical protein
LVSDIYTILTDSLSRSGSGGMTTAFKVADGAVGTPAYSFTSEGASGLYRAGANDILLSVAGVDKCSWTVAGFLAAAADIAVLDRAGTIGIGTTSGTTITLGRAGQVLTVASTLDAATVDRAGTINIGTSSATTITIGRSGQTLSLPGTVSGTGTWAAWNKVVATGDTSNSATATPTDIAGLTFACASGHKYLVRAKLFVYSAAGATGLGISAKATGAPTRSSAFFAHTHWNQFTTEHRWGTYTDFNDSPAAFTDTGSTTATAPQVDDFDGYFVTTGAGTFQLYLVTEVNASAVTVKEGSYLEWMDVT